MSYHQPTDSEIRERIEAVKDDKYRHAFMFQLLCCARISEVCGKYAPSRESVIETEFNGEQAALFIVKTAKRKGRLRPCAVPLNPLYEPWAKPLLDYFKDCKEEYPFKFHENPAHSIRYMQWEAEEAFDGMMWPMIEYTRTEDLPYTQDMVLDKRYGETGFDQHLVELQDGERYWTYNKDIVKRSRKIQSRWKPFRSHCLRKRRSITLTLDYGFDGFDIAYFGGWTETGKDESIPSALKHYLHMDLSSAEESFTLLKKMANRYFKKLCVPMA